MGLTKKDFIKFALQLSHIGDDAVRETKMKAYLEVLKQTNPAFDENRFVRYVEEHARKNKLGY